MVEAVPGVIGGSGLYDLPGLEDVCEERIEERLKVFNFPIQRVLSVLWQR